MSFTPYYDEDILEHIDTLNLHEMLELIRSANLAQLKEYNDDLIVECQIDPAFRRSKFCRASAKAIARGIQRCTRRGEYLIEDIGPPLTIAGMIAAAMEGMIIGDEWARRMRG